MNEKTSDARQYSEKELVADVLKSIKATFPEMYAAHLSNAQLRRSFVESHQPPAPDRTYSKKKFLGKVGANLRLLYSLVTFLREVDPPAGREYSGSLSDVCICTRGLVLGMAIEWVNVTFWTMITRCFSKEIAMADSLLVESDWSVVVVEFATPRKSWKLRQAETIGICLTGYRLLGNALGELTETRQALHATAKKL